MALTKIIENINAFAWGLPMMVLLAGTGLFLSFKLSFMPQRNIGYGLKMLWHGRHVKADEQGDISPFNALMTAMSATIGTGNIAGVATAIFFGGPGALFWMWLVALVGMATKYCEAVLAVRFRQVDSKGHYVGGPMYYIRYGLGNRWRWLAVTFAVFGMLAGFGIGNTVQSNSVANVMQATFYIPSWVSGFTMTVLAGLVLIGGIQRIGHLAGRIVPLMAALYVGGSLLIIALNISKVPATFSLVFAHAFTPISASGGFAGATVWAALQFGVARGIFSNEAGLGSAPIAHASAKVDNPLRQGMIAMLGTFIDTLVICTMTGLVILLTGSWQSGMNSAALSAHAFELALGPVGSYIVSIGISLFAFTTLIGWSFYSEKCAQYLFGDWVITPFRLVWLAIIPIGTLPNIDLGSIWLLADTLNAFMAIPNLIALLLLSPVVLQLTRRYFRQGVGILPKPFA